MRPHPYLPQVKVLLMRYLELLMQVTAETCCGTGVLNGS